MINAKFHQSIHMIDQLVASQAERSASCISSSKAIRVIQFKMLNTPTFTGVKEEEDPQGLMDEIKKIFRVMQATNVEGVNFFTY